MYYKKRSTENKFLLISPANRETITRFRITIAFLSLRICHSSTFNANPNSMQNVCHMNPVSWSTAIKRLGQCFVLFREISFTVKWNYDQGCIIITVECKFVLISLPKTGFFTFKCSATEQNCFDKWRRSTSPSLPIFKYLELFWLSSTKVSKSTGC